MEHKSFATLHNIWGFTRALNVLIFLLGCCCVVAVLSQEIPPENRPTKTNRSQGNPPRPPLRPPPRPPLGQTETKAKKLLDAILQDQPQLSSDFFFPRDPFRLLKGIADPDKYWRHLYQAYERDVHALHREIPHGSTFKRFLLSHRGGFILEREEANRLPYWCSRHSWIEVQPPGAGVRPKRFEVRTLINWGQEWYITHLK